MSKIIKKCEHCGTEFEVKRSDSKCCSKKCSTKMWKKNNSEKIKEMNRKWREVNSEKIKETYRKWRESNPEKVKEICSKWQKANPEKAKEKSRKWHKANPEKVKGFQKKWREANPEKANEVVRRHHYRQAGYPEELLEIKELQYQIKKEMKKQTGEKTNDN
jgi:hypothetical protein